MNVTAINSAAAPGAVGGYSQAVLLDGPHRILFISGQIPEATDGRVPDDFETQCRLTWANVLAQLNAADMAVANLTKVTVFLSAREFAESNSRIRREVLGSHKPALTVVVAEILDEKWLLEIEAVAAA